VSGRRPSARLADALDGEHAQARTPADALMHSTLRARAMELVRRQPRAVRVALACALLPLALIVGFAVDRAFSFGRIQRGVWIGSIAASGLDPASGERELARTARRLATRRVCVQIGRRLFWVDAKALGFSLDARATAAAAFEVGRQGGVYDELASWASRFADPARLASHASIDMAALERMLASFEADALGDAPFEGGVRVIGDAVSPEYPRAGWRVDRGALRRMILERILEERDEIAVAPTVYAEPRLDRAAVDDAVRRARALLSAPVELVDDLEGATVRIEAAALAGALRGRPGGARLELAFDVAALEPALAPLRARVERAPQDASFEPDTHDRVRIVPSRLGTRIDGEHLAAAILEAALAPARKAALPVYRDLAPRFTTEQAHALGIVERVGQFTTRHACCQPRVQNIHRIADLMRDVVVRPGETLSVNAVIGPRTQKNGFVMAPGIEEGEMVDSVGGGVSQFATTLFNAVFHAGYDIVERQAHSYWFSRYPMGIEATLSSPKPDLVFRNDTNAGLVIKTEYTDTSITVRLYGNGGGRRVTAEVSPQREVTQPPVELIPNPSFSPDESDVKESGLVGWSVLVSRLVRYPDGTEKRESRKVTYKPRPRRIEVHPCKIAKGQPGYSGEPCPVPERSSDEQGASPSDIPEVK
jgi:vancomycin resistance protein YoaR